MTDADRYALAARAAEVLTRCEAAKRHPYPRAFADTNHLATTDLPAYVAAFMAEREERKMWEAAHRQACDELNAARQQRIDEVLRLTQVLADEREARRTYTRLLKQALADLRTYQAGSGE